METPQVLAIVLGVLLTAIMGAVSWLVRAVIYQGREVAVIRAEIRGQDGTDDEVKQLLRVVSGKLDEQHGDIRKMFERTEWLMRVNDRHERFFEAIQTEMIGGKTK